MFDTWLTANVESAAAAGGAVAMQERGTVAGVTPSTAVFLVFEAEGRMIYVSVTYQGECKAAAERSRIGEVEEATRRFEVRKVR